MISVIVPIYNVKDYLERCVNSIINQTYRKLEIILVDDGSTDGSAEICDCFAQKDNRVIVIHKENGGAASARNCGLDIATGEFVGFVDSDDYIAYDMYEHLLKYMNKNVDITSCGTVYIGKTNMNSVRCKAKSLCVMNRERALEELMLHRLLCFSSCDKLFRYSILKDVRYISGKVCEDLPFIYELINKCNNVVNIGEAKYFYQYRENSVSRMPFTNKRLDYVLFTRDMYRDVCVNNPKLMKAAEYRYIINIISIINQIESSSNKQKYINECKRLKSVIRNMIFRILNNSYFNKMEKRECISILFNR